MKRVSMLLLLVIVALGLSAVVLPMKQSGTAFKVSANDRCRRVRGTINSLFFTDNCTSPIGLCTAGTITGSGLLDGPTSFIALDAAPSAGLPAVEASANLS